MNINSFDLNLLLVFEALYRERHVGRAARSLGLSQPATSSALARLRALLDDPLFLRGQREMSPTPRAAALAPAILESLATLRHTFSGPAPHFDFATARHTFRLCLSDLAESQILPPLLATVTPIAPGIQFQIERPATLFDAPDPSSRAHLHIGFLPDARLLPSSWHTQTLAEEHNVVVARRNHPRLRRGLDFALFTSLGHAAVIYRPEATGMIDAILASRGARRNLRYASPHFHAVLAAVASSDLIACLPASWVRANATQFPVRTFPLPIELPPFTTRMAWPSSLHHDPAHLWLRQTILTARKSPPSRSSS